MFEGIENINGYESIWIEEATEKESAELQKEGYFYCGCGYWMRNK